MRKFSFLALCIALYVGFIFVKIYQHNHYIQVMFENQRYKEQKKKLINARNEKYKELFSKSSNLCLTPFSHLSAEAKPITLKNIIYLKPHETTDENRT